MSQHTAGQHLAKAIYELEEARGQADLHPKWDAKLGEAEIDMRGVLHRLENRHTPPGGPYRSAEESDE